MDGEKENLNDDDEITLGTSVVMMQFKTNMYVTWRN